MSVIIVSDDLHTETPFLSSYETTSDKINWLFVS